MLLAGYSSLRPLQRFLTSPVSNTGRLVFFLSYCCCFNHQFVRSMSSSSSSINFRTQRLGDGTIIVSPKHETDQSALIVISHGLGDTAEGFADVAEHLAKQMPYVKFILPTAPTQRVTMNMGMSMPSWYDIVGLDERSNENCPGIDESRARIAGILEKEHLDTGLPYSRMVLAGFSQGGALSLFTGLQGGGGGEVGPLAAVIVLSGYLPAAAKFQLKWKETPVLHCHGDQDMVVPYRLASKSKQAVTSLGLNNYELKSYKGLGHSVNMEELSDVLRFLQKVLPADDTCRIKLKDPSEMSIKELKAAIRDAGLSRLATGFMEKSEYIKLLRDHRDGKL